MNRRGAAWDKVVGGLGKRSIALAALIGGAFLAWAVSFYAPGVMDRITGLFHDDPRPPPSVEITVAPEFNSAWLFPSTRDALGEPPAKYCDSNEYRRWLRTAKATPTANMFAVTLKANTDATAIVEGMSVRVLERRRPLEGIVLDCPIGGPGDGGPIGTATINLDHARPSIAYTESYNEPTKRLAFKLVKGVDQFLIINGESTRSLVTWEASLLLSVDGERSAWASSTSEPEPKRSSPPAQGPTLASPLAVAQVEASQSPSLPTADGLRTPGTAAWASMTWRGGDPDRRSMTSQDRAPTHPATPGSASRESDVSGALRLAHRRAPRPSPRLSRLTARAMASR